MPQCATCSAPLTQTNRFCSSCGAPVESSSATPTGTAPRGEARAASGQLGSAASRSLSSTAVGEARFAPGTMLLERYRIVGPLGKGGMGEVYRADDLKLGQPVALKFLPEKLAASPDRLGRFYNEVRIAREITHPSVCRVHDVGELEGQPFLSMEYVDGENLASLLRRIGRLPAGKAVEIVRQVCAGLAAAHEKGVLHRDLKPENVMLDGRGRARITDFGLAALAEDVRGAEVRSGTPAYMAPEQLAGREVTVQSDLYALGLVLYELFTGKRPFEGQSLAELTRKHIEEAPPSPSTLVPDIDPALESLILRCLQKDPRKRPASALAVAAALPGADPLAAALAAGETPSPELVAAAGEAGGLRPAVAWAMLAATLLGLAAAVALSQGTQLLHLMPFEKSPDALEDRARDVLTELGREGAADSARGFWIDLDYLRHVTAKDRSPDRWDSLKTGRPAASSFWYRHSPRPLVAADSVRVASWDDPPPRISGMAGVRLDMQGRLVEFHAVTPQLEEPGGEPAPPDWSPLFARAGLDPRAFRAVQPRWTPPFYCDTRAAWEGVFPDAPEIPVRIEASSYRGRPVHFQILGDWTRPGRMERLQLTPGERWANWIGASMLVLVMLAAVLLARRNLRLGRGDRQGARRLAAYALTATMLAWALRAHHVGEFGGEVSLIVNGFGRALVATVCLWLLYLALEPYVRRRWPDALISWTRLLGGGVRDPLVGRHVLVGGVAGSLFAVVVQVSQRLPGWLGSPPPQPGFFGQEILLGPRYAASRVISQQVEAVAIGLGLLLLLVLLRGLLRSEWLATLALALPLSIQTALQADMPFLLALSLFALAWMIPAVVVLRFGLLSLCATIFFLALGVNYPLTLDLGHWAGHATILFVLVAAGTAGLAFRASLAGRPLFRGNLLQD